jgi:lipoprotein-anchoring transpeptidase ErfK/SrfK
VRRGLTISLLIACAAAGLLSSLLLAATPSATADTGTTTGTTTAPPPPTTTTPPPTVTTPPPTTPVVPPPPRPTTIAAGVTVAGEVLVGGLSPADATLVVKEYFARPLVLRLRKVTLRVTPKQLGASAFVGDAIKRARVAAPGANVPLKVEAPRSNVERYVRTLAGRFDRPAVDSQQSFRNLRPFVTKERSGRRLIQAPVVRNLFLSLKTHARTPIAMKQETVKPSVTRASAGYVIVIHRGENRLRLYDGMKLHRTFGVATGESRYPTPIGNFRIVVKWRNPWWYPPASDWAKDAEPIPPGPGNPLGTRWMGLSVPAVGIHGTPDPASIGYSVSHGCIRMRIPEAEWLFNEVEIGTPVYIVR